MGSKKNDEKKTPTYKRELKSLNLRTGKREPLIVLSFKHFDLNQGQSFEEWEKENLLALAVNRLRQVCELTVAQAGAGQVIKQYTKVGFPPNSAFKHPKHVMPDVTWSCMHIQGKECVIGFFEDNVFHIVFLDKNHEFWKTEKKNT